MYSRSPSRINRSRGIKVKHILQMCLLVAVCFWLIYQVKHSHEKKKEFEEKDAKLASDTQSDGEILRLGRKDISRVTEVGRDDKINGEDDEENESDQAENRHEDDEQEREESRTEEREEEEDTSKGGGDDEIDRSEEEENHEEFVDEEKDREETDEKNEDNDVGEKEDNEESEAVLEDQDHEGGTKNTHEAREEQYKADDASSEVAHDTRSNLPETENATLKHTDRSSEQIIDGKENVSQSSNQPLLDENSHEQIKGSNSSDSRVSESMEHKGNFTLSGYSTSENSTALMESSDQSQVSNSLTQLESEQSSKITQAQNATSEDSHNEVSNATLISFSHVNTSDLALDKNPLDIKTVVNSTELGNTTSPEVKFSLAENSTRAAETTVDDGNSVNAGADDNPGNNSEDNATGGEDESSDTDTANDNVGADLHDNVDDFASSLTQEEKEYRTDTGTLPDIKVEVQNADDMEAEE